MEYDWYKRYVMQKHHELKELQKNNDSEEIRQAIATSEDLLLYREKKSKRIPSTAEKFFNEYQRLQKAKLILPDIQSFANLKCENLNFDDEVLTRSQFEPEVLLEITHDFFKHGTNKKIFLQFMHFYKQRKRNVHFINDPNFKFYAESFYLPYYRNLFIQMQPRHEFEDAATLAHEYGHGIHFLNNFHQNFYYKNFLFLEIISTFFEYLLLLHYSHHEDYGYIATNSLIDIFEERKIQANNLNSFLAYKDYMDLKPDMRKDEIIQNINRFLEFYGEDDIKKYLQDASPSEDPIYIFATSIVCELICIYYEDADKAFYLVDKLMNIDPRLSPEEYYLEILKLGITPNENINTFNEHLKRELTRFS